MAVLRLFASAREAAGVTTDQIPGATVEDVIQEACRRYGQRFVAVLKLSKVWVNGEPAVPTMAVKETDVVAVLPPVSGGAAEQQRPEPARPPIVRGNLALVPELPEEAPAPATATKPEPERPKLAVVHRSTRPHGRLGLAWAAVTVGITVAGTSWLAVWMAVAAFMAGAQTCVVWRKRGERPVTLAAAAIACALPVAASFDLSSMVGVVVGGVLVTFVARLRAPTRAPSRDIALTVAIGVPIGLAAASPVLVRHTGIAAALLLFALICFYDASAYLVGTGAASAWEGPAAGVTALVPLTIFAQVALLPPFSGTEPLLLGILAAVTAPIGPVAASALLGDRGAHAPALRRLDSLLLLGPLWAWVAVIFLQ
jgi:molybdopterin synthase sulfur carrier subunit